MNNRKWNKLELQEAVSKSSKMIEVLNRLGLQVAGGNYETIKWWIKKYELDTSHFSRLNPMKGKNYVGPLKRELNTILVENSKYSSYKLKNRLIKEKILKEKCCGCKKTIWNSRLTNGENKKIPLELEHKNGNHFDNRLENLELLCPNCHSFTETYGGKNKKKA